MTSRLKRKLNDLGVDPSSSKANESFCLIGTPLPPLEKSKDTGEFVPLWKQEVRDEKGRRRLHGAFTGGFSAGYFNSVGSKEGWAPSTFVSSRSDRAKKNQARPEDFMDEEDLAELRESKQLVDENDEMDFGGTEAELRRRTGADNEDDTMANALAASLAPASQDSVGARILKKMGWRMGQGIGPRVTYQQRRTQDHALGAAAEEGDDEEAKKHMYPRRDTPLLIVPRKDNSHGLGYTPGMGLNESLGVKGGADAKGSRISAGFGLGALNDADEDDLDVYDGTLTARGSRRLAYDAVDDDDQIAMGSSRHRQSKPSHSSSGAVTQTFRDGRPVVKGFVISDQPVAEDRWFPLPDVPKGWKPDPRRVWNIETNKENLPSAKGKERAQLSKSHAEWKSSLLSADERGSLLGETPLPSQPRSIFDFMSQKDRERLDKIKNNLSAPPPPPPPAALPAEPAPSLNQNEVIVPPIHPSVAKAALSGFQPFVADPVKHARYTAFLQHTSQDATGRTGIGIGPLPGQSIEQFNKELADYAKSATVFKPLSGAMAGRFRSAVVIESGPKIIEGLHTPDLSSADDVKQEDGQGEKEDEDPRMVAVRLGMYGPLTREVVPWLPARLLCRRFGVKEPEMDPADAAAQPEAKDAGVPDPTQPAPAAAPLAITDGTAVSDPDDLKPVVRNFASIGLGEDETQGQDTLTYQRPAMDIFKAIFASDDEESDEEEVDEVKEEPVEPALNTAPSSLQPAVSAAASVVSKPNEVEERIDLATFKPTFVPRSDRDSRKEKDKDREKEKKKKKAKTTLVSFDDGEEDGGLQVNVAALKSEKRKKHKDKDKGRDEERKKKKLRKEEAKDEGDDDSMWVEKPAPDVVQNIDFNAAPTAGPQDTIAEVVAGPPRGRKRAVDFM